MKKLSYSRQENEWPTVTTPVPTVEQQWLYRAAGFIYMLCYRLATNIFILPSTKYLLNLMVPTTERQLSSSLNYFELKTLQVRVHTTPPDVLSLVKKSKLLFRGQVLPKKSEIFLA